MLLTFDSAEPMMKIIASGWDKVFSRRSPMVMASFSRNSANCLRKFHKDTEARARQAGIGIAGLHMLQQQVVNYENLLKDLSASTKETINSNQKEINREFVPVIEQAMEVAYEQCNAERGELPCLDPIRQTRTYCYRYWELCPYESSNGQSYCSRAPHHVSI